MSRKKLWSLLAALAVATPALAQVGSEFRVNSYTTGRQYQYGRAVAADGSGNFVVVWEQGASSLPADVATRDVVGQRLDSSGTPIGGQFAINTYTTGAQGVAAVGANAAGDFVVVWRSTGQDGSGTGVFARRFDPAGAAQGDEFQVNAYTTGTQSRAAVALDSAGGFVIAWASNLQDGNGYGVVAKRYDSSGNPIGGEFVVNTYTTGNQYTAALASDPSGNFVVLWSGAGAGDGNGVFARRFNSSGSALGGEFRVNTYTTQAQYVPAIAMRPTGEFVVAWTSGTSLPSGGNHDGSFAGIFARRFDASGSALGAQFLVNSYTTDYQIRPAVGIVPSGEFVVAWTSGKYPNAAGGQDGSFAGVFGQSFDAAGNPTGSEFRINSFTPSAQRQPSIAAHGSQFMVAWNSYSQDGSDWGIYAQRYALGTDVTAPSVTVIAPNGGEKVFTGAPYTIRWSASDDVALDHIDVAYSVNNGVSYNPVPGCTGLPGTATSCVWAAPGPPSSGAFVRVTAIDTSANSASDTSDARFTIIAGTPFITITAPTVAGTIWKVGDAKQVRFNHNLGAGEPVLIELNRDYPGGSWETITGSGCAATTQNTNSTCNLTVTNPPTNGFTARVRVTWVTNPVVTDVSDNNFRIQGRVTVTQPNTAVTWAAGSTKAIKWSHTLGLASSFDIAKDSDGDLICETPVASGVAAATATAGSYNWVVSGTGSANRICVTNAANPADTDISDMAFTITP